MSTVRLQALAIANGTALEMTVSRDGIVVSDPFQVRTESDLNQLVDTLDEDVTMDWLKERYQELTTRQATGLIETVVTEDDAARLTEWINASAPAMV